MSSISLLAAPSSLSGAAEIVGDPLPVYVAPGSLLAAIVVVLGIALVAANLRARNAVSWESLDSEAAQFTRGQLRRRLQTSIVIFALGVVMFVGLFVREPYWFMTCWFCVCLAVLWLAASALMDVFWTRQYYGQLRQRQRAETAYWQGELQHWRESHGKKGTTESDREVSE